MAIAAGLIRCTGVYLVCHFAQVHHDVAWFDVPVNEFLLVDISQVDADPSFWNDVVKKFSAELEFESLPTRYSQFFHLRKGLIPGTGVARTLCRRAEIALHVFRLIKYVAVYEMATVFMVPSASGCGLGARSDLVYEPGGCCAGRGRAERRTIRRKPVTTFEEQKTLPIS